MNKFKKVFSYFLPFLKKNKWYAVSIPILFSLGSTAGNTLAPLFYRKIVDDASLQFLSKDFDLTILTTTLWWILALIVLAGITQRLASHFMNNYMDSFSNDVHQDSFDMVARQSYNFFTNNFVGTLVGKVGRLSRNLRNLYEIIVFGFFLLFVDIALSIVILFQQNAQLGFIFLIFMTVFVLFSVLFIRKQASYDKLRSQQASIRTGVISDIFANMFNVQVFSTRNLEHKYYGSVLKKLSQARLRSWRYYNTIRIRKNIFFLIFEIVSMYFALKLFTEQQISLGTLVLVQSYLLTIIMSAWSLDRSLVGFIETFSDSSDAIDVVTTHVSVQDKLNVKKIEMNKGKVFFENVSFTYPEGDHVFEKFNLTIQPGQSIGVVGRSGSGKTTLTKLLLRFYDIDAGKISIDTQDISDVAQESLRLKIAYIPQETILFHRSIYENIAYGNSKASREEVMLAAQAAHVDEFVQNLEKGYKTKVGERGVKLSGGQRQRIGIARAMLKKDAPILILDEATSSLDSISEQYIQESFEKLSKNRTTIVIAHRLSTIQKMNRIIVMDKGQIIEDGTHEELFTLGGHYHKLWNSQVNGFINETEA